MGKTNLTDKSKKQIREDSEFETMFLAKFVGFGTFGCTTKLKPIIEILPLRTAQSCKFSSTNSQCKSSVAAVRKKMAPKRICLIGAGPSGMSVLYQLERLRKEGVAGPLEVVCYEKQDNWGGLWNYTWRTGNDEHGEPVHGSMYRYLWSNGPKEALEFPDYTFEDHYGKAIPSFPPREVLFDYLQGRWKKADLKKLITFKTVVRSVKFDEDTEKFFVVTESLTEKKVMPTQLFDYVMVASGHYSTPFVPTYPGVEKFPGRVMHSHDFRDACEFEGKRLLVVSSMILLFFLIKVYIF